jgi:quercetin dioxygenase-like cupin family protein
MFSYHQLKEIVKHNVRGGAGEVHCRDYINKDSQNLPFNAFGLNEMQPGATIPEHCHADSAEFYYIVSGKGLGWHNGRSFEVGPGDGWLCKAGETHGIHNDQVPGQVLVFVSVFFQE